MTGVITWVVDCGDGVCIEREQPSPALKSMPAYGALNSSFKAASQPVDVITNDYVTGDGSDQLQLNSNLDKPEADGFLKLGDIKGEFSPSRVADAADPVGLDLRIPLSDTETQVYQNGELVKSSRSSGADEGTEVVPGQQNGDADSNDVVIGNYLSSVDSESDVIDAITVFVKPVAAGADYQNDLILNYGAFDGASMLEAYEATRADAYSQKDTLASAVEAPYNEMNYMLDPSQGPSNTTDESESLMFVAMMTVETVGL